MTEPPQDDDWGQPALYQSGGRTFEPRTFTEADPISQVLLIDWSDQDESGAPQWSAPTYVGPRRLRRKAARADEPAGVPEEAPADAIEGPGPAPVDVAAAEEA
ncbi:MAG TPA: hypothetical protein VJ831_14195, partial [Jatrophihabitantaceae bacterium]|nr:hypothetical protein [Jatrophihabitantaceae bacterium]